MDVLDQHRHYADDDPAIMPATEPEAELIAPALDTSPAEAAYRWQRWQDECGDPQPPQDWSSLSAKHGD